ncbi:hypothetical protein SELMODRAFT_404508 [Selaginella moellendorffii]|uniref:Uncharacterized protein n=1 Tax=Selaginella moellendorffii TaxID=88036 RepID=D8QVK0_SELML|nr:hypothetical protein SELMODRAFT_404508 [Selaginella moellendorffii]
MSVSHYDQLSEKTEQVDSFLPEEHARVCTPPAVPKQNFESFSEDEELEEAVNSSYGTLLDIALASNSISAQRQLMIHEREPQAREIQAIVQGIDLGNEESWGVFQRLWQERPETMVRCIPLVLLDKEGGSAREKLRLANVLRKLVMEQQGIRESILAEPVFIDFLCGNLCLMSSNLQKAIFDLIVALGCQDRLENALQSDGLTKDERSCIARLPGLEETALGGVDFEPGATSIAMQEILRIT